MSGVTFAAATADDVEALADLRVQAMRPSLEALGRFDNTRARARVTDNFVAADTRMILRDGALIGFFVTRARKDHILLDDLYLLPEAQGQGVGADILNFVKSRARGKKLPLRLIALKESRANEFYLRHGFAVTGEDEFDVHYEFTFDA